MMRGERGEAVNRDTLAGTPLLDDAERAFAKIEGALPRGRRRFLDQLPWTLKAKSGGRKKHDVRRLREILARALDATLLHRRAAMRHASASSRLPGTRIAMVPMRPAIPARTR
jgi:hypothetical protein